jgi:hypothetical protein
MYRDWLGNAVTTDDPDTVAAIDQFTTSLLTVSPGDGAIFRAAARDPDSPLAPAHAAALCLLGQTPEMLAQARGYLDLAAARLAQATDRERRYVETLRAWTDGDTAASLDGFVGLTTAHPRDLVAIALGSIACTGAGESERCLRLTEPGVAAAGEVGYVHGMHAFALEQNGRLAEAENAGLRAVAMNRHDPGAHHALAHVYLTAGQAEEGAAFLRAHADTWDGCHSHMYSHNWWHLALFHYDRRDYDTCLEILDTRVWGRDKGFAQDQVNAIGLLARLGLAGLDLGGRWADVATQVAPHRHDHVQPLLDLHYVYALAAAGRDREAAEMLDSLRAHAAAQTRDRERAAWRDAALPLAEGLVAFAARDWARAAERLGRGERNWQAVGGSHAQRALFEEMRAAAETRR